MEDNDLGFVVFARNRIPFNPQHYIRALFTMDVL